MKKILYGMLMGSVLLFTATSCEKEIEDLSQITYYVDLQLKGEKEIWMELNTPYNEPGYTATENGVDIAEKVKVFGSVKTNEVGYYPLYYSAQNKDGFSVSDSRDVFVYDPSVVSDHSGTYSVEGTRTTSVGSDSFSGFTVTVSLVKPGFYAFSDFIGGYYSQGKGYGDDYSLSGYASINTNGVVKGLYSYVAGWGDSATSIDGTLNTDNTIDMVVYYAGMKFEYKLTKI